MFKTLMDKMEITNEQYKKLNQPDRIEYLLLNKDIKDHKLTGLTFEIIKDNCP